MPIFSKEARPGEPSSAEIDEIPRERVRAGWGGTASEGADQLTSWGISTGEHRLFKREYGYLEVAG